jgi:hypothetical protein
MTHDHQVFAFVDDPHHEDSVRSIELSAQLQSTISTMFEEQAAALFSERLEPVSFDGAFNASDGEVFCIDNFHLPGHVISAAEKPHTVKPLSAKEIRQFRMKGAFATKVSRRGSITEALFQVLDRSSVITKERTLVFGPDRFQSMKDNAISLSSHLCAGYRNGVLRFFSYSAAKRVLDLTKYFHEASDDEIRQLLSAPLFSTSAPGAIIAIADQWIRRRFSIISASGILEEKLDASAIRRGGKKYGVDLRLEGERVVVPQEKVALKGLLRYLAEEFYDGVITGKPYVTNSKRILQLVA